MVITYDFTAVDMLHLLGCDKPAGKEELEAFEKETNQKLPQKLFEFLSVAMHHPLFSTADIWAADRGPFLHFFYEEIEEGIDDCKGDWEEDPEVCSENAFYPFSQLPREQWSEHVPNYLLIGSDYAAGVVEYGIRKEDLSQENPSVYVQHEANPLTDWKLYYDTLEGYLMRVLCDILVGAEYDIPKRALKNAEWEFYDYSGKEELEQELSKSNISLSKTKNYCSGFEEDVCYRCCYNEEEKVVYIVKDDVSLVVLEIH